MGNANYHDGFLQQGQAMPALYTTVLLSADNQAVEPGIYTMILIGSDNTTSTNRTFTLGSSTVGVGHELTLVWNTGSSTTGQLVDTGIQKLLGDWVPLQYDSLHLVFDGTNWVEVARSNVNQNLPTIPLASAKILVGNSGGLAAAVDMSGDATITNAGVVAIGSGVIVNADVSGSAAIAYSKLNLATSIAVTDFAETVMVQATGTLTQANIIAMNATPVTLVAAPGAGKLIIVDEIELFHDYATAVYSAGGDVSIQYATSAAPVSVIDVAVVTASADANFILKPSASYTSSASTSSATDLSTSVNKAIEITNATAAFADGNASNIFKFRVRYHTVTVLT